MKRFKRQAGFTMIFVITLLAIQTTLVFTGTRRIWLLDRELDAIEARMHARRATWHLPR